MAFLGFSKRRPLGMCFFADETGAGGDGGAGGGDVGGGAGGSGAAGMAGAGAGGDAGAGAGASDFAVPETYRNEAWAKDIKSHDDLWKKTYGSQKLIGERAVPKHDDKPEAWEAFFSKTRPEGGKYKLNEEGIFDNFKGNQEFSGALTQVFHKAGLTQKQVDILMDPKDGYSGLMKAEIGKLAGAAQAQATEADSTFESKTAELFGDRKEVAVGNAIKLLEEATSELKLKDGLDELIAQDPDKLAGLAVRLDYIHRTYISGDKLDGKGDGGKGGSSNDPTLLQSQLDQYKSKNWEAYSNPNHTAYPEVMRNVQSLVTKISALQ
jgi:hypothetical protein